MDIQVKELKDRLEQGEDVLLVDVREPYEHEEFNIGGMLIPMGNLMERLEDLEKNKEKEIIVYCKTGQRSGVAKHLMQQAGFTNVRNLLGGVVAWQNMDKEDQ